MPACHSSLFSRRRRRGGGEEEEGDPFRESTEACWRNNGGGSENTADQELRTLGRTACAGAACGRGRCHATARECITPALNGGTRRDAVREDAAVHSHPRAKARTLRLPRTLRRFAFFAAGGLKGRQRRRRGACCCLSHCAFWWRTIAITICRAP